MSSTKEPRLYGSKDKPETLQTDLEKNRMETVLTVLQPTASHSQLVSDTASGSKAQHRDTEESLQKKAGRAEQTRCKPRIEMQRVLENSPTNFSHCCRKHRVRAT